MKAQFIEEKLGTGFCKDQISYIQELITSSTTFTLSGMPGVGGSIFLRYLSLQPFAHFIYIDTYQLAEITRLNYYQLLLNELGSTQKAESEQEAIELCRQELQKLCQKEDRIVLILNRFDQLKDQFNNQLFADLMSLRNISLEKIVFIFTANKPYLEILPDTISADKVGLFAKTVYLKPYSTDDLRTLLTISNNVTNHTPEFIDKALELSGGHYQLLQLFLKSERLDPPFIDPFVKYQFKEIYEYLNYQQKRIVEKVSQGKKVDVVDPYLLGVGIVKQEGTYYTLFTPLFADFIKTSISPKMSIKEIKLFNLLHDNLGQVIPTEEIFASVWEGNSEEATEWALSSLLYRLRKHPKVVSQNYIIESHKKMGYMMIKG